MSDLANLLGDGDGAGLLIRKVRPITSGVKVSREGEAVIVQIGNAEPVRLRWRTAIEEGQALMREAWRNRNLLDAKSRRAALRIFGPRQAALFGCLDAVRIGRWMLAKGMEAKFLAGDNKRLLVERR